MVVNNFDNLVDYFNLLKSKEDFYYVQVIQRKKDGHRKSERVIKNFYIYSKEDFLKKKNYIIELDIFDAPFAPLILAEVEFDTENDANDFVPPEWFDNDVTFDPAYHNSNLSKKQF